MHRGFLKQQLVYLVLLVLACYRIWMGLNQPKVWIWVILAIVVLGLYVNEIWKKKRK